jgi:integrase
MEAVHKTDLAKSIYGLASNQLTVPFFRDFCETYLTFSQANKRAYVVERYYIEATLCPIFGKYRLNEITALMVEEFKQRRLRKGLKKSSINREIGLLKSMLTSAVKWKLVTHNGANEAKLFRLDNPPMSRILATDEEVNLLRACDDLHLRLRAPHLRLVILIALYTGLRRGEILALRWADIDLENRILLVRKSKTPAGQGRKVNLNSRLYDALYNQHREANSEWVFPSFDRFQDEGRERHICDIKHAFQKAVKLSGIPKITFHQLRHTFCSRLANAGVSMSVIQELAGHSSILTTRRYTHPDVELKRKAVEMLVDRENDVRSQDGNPY